MDSKFFNSHSSDRRRFLQRGALLATGGTLLGGANNLFGLSSEDQQLPDGGQMRYEGPWFNVMAFGARGDGVTDDSNAIQRAVDALDAAGQGILYFPSNGRYKIAEEVQLRANNMTVWLWGAEIIGPVSGTSTGGLLTVVDRRSTTRILNNVSVYGGLIKVQSSSDNGLNVANGYHIFFCGVRVVLAPGENGFAIQSDSSAFSGTPPAARYIRLSGCECYGTGTAGVSLEFAGIDNLLADIIVEDMNIDGMTNAVVCSNVGSGLFMNRISISNCIFTNCGTGIFLEGVQQSTFNNLIMNSMSFRGIEVHSTYDCLISGVAISGLSGSNGGVVLFDYARLNLTNFDISGPFLYGVYNGMNDATIGPGKIYECTNGIVTTSDTQRSVYSGVEFDTCPTMFTAYRAGDQYFKIIERAGTRALLIRDDTTISPPV